LRTRDGIRQMQRQAANDRMMSDVPNADVIITNPTHSLWRSLKYDKRVVVAPVCSRSGVTSLR